MKDREVFIPGVPQETLADVRVGLWARVLHGVCSLW